MGVYSSSFSTELAAVAALLLALKFALRRWVLGSPSPHLDRIPGLWPTLPFLGDLGHLLLQPRSKLVRWGLSLVSRLGPTFRFWLGSAPFVVLTKPEDYEVIIGSGKFNTKPKIVYGTVETFFGRGLATLNGDAWRLHRKHITHAFHFRILERYVDVFERKAGMLADKLRPLANGTSFNVFPQFAYVTNETIFETAFGLDADANAEVEPERRQEFVDAMEFAFDVMQERVIKPWLLVDWIFRLTETGRRFFKADRMIDEFAERVIQDRRVKLLHAEQSQDDDEGVKNYSFLDLMMKLDPNGEDRVLNDAEIRGELRTFISVQQTSATIMSFAMMLLALHPDVQERVVDEANDELQGGITYQSLLGLKHLERVIKETMRLYPVLPVFARDVTEDVRVSDCTIPAGCCVALGIVVTHRDARFWDAPDSFDPDRFLPERCAGRHPYAYLPFSAGTRNCIGQKYAMMQMKAVMTTLLRRYVVLPGKGYRTLRDLEDHLDVTTFLCVAGGFNIRLQPRDPSAPTSSPPTRFTDLLEQQEHALLRAAR